MRPNFDNQWTDNDEPVFNWPNLGDQGETLSICADFAEVMELPCGLKLEVCEQAEGSLKAWWRIVNSNCG
jgi:hypothetical protein